MKKELTDLEAKIEEQSNGTDFKNAKLQSEILQLLMNKKLTSFHFPRGLNLLLLNSATKLWERLLVEQPPDLHTIVCKCTMLNSLDIRPFFSSLLSVFPKLEVLRLANFDCTNHDLIKIAHHLPKLRSVLDFKACCEKLLA
jgi:hypothetical protein